MRLKIRLYHDRTRSYDFRYNEGRRFQLLISVAKKNGAEWVFIGSPKTRFSEEFKTQIAPSVEKYRGVPVILALKERYLWGDFEHYAYINTVGDGYDKSSLPSRMI